VTVSVVRRTRKFSTTTAIPVPATRQDCGHFDTSQFFSVFKVTVFKEFFSQKLCMHFQFANLAVCLLFQRILTIQIVGPTMTWRPGFLKPCIGLQAEALKDSKLLWLKCFYKDTKFGLPSVLKRVTYYTRWREELKEVTSATLAFLMSSSVSTSET
jgi:hypothetical protein